MEYQQANYKFIEAKEAKELIDNVRPLIIDVRTAGEYAQGKIAGSLLIPIDEIQMRYSEIEKYKNQDVFIYCASGNRSTVAARILINNGFKRIYNLKNGIAGWQASGYSVEK
ncbi:MAG: hypothetical protein A2504_14865 [Bdellovibrionales bacterium RIFOXYD12_FULL_39_22]|nr:MAG: hypothetical protein A2385_10330 [Bdellovibrionales bacterium RIFOXYB1_FULL_39_21]OFZ40879.1 MAG: hypothetical protein A2485_17490 [Bdellovibrionales bacterium RIFOXYC12_FULL_39_17]OFZ44420.1 MAG: hypothetical protein A2404_11100 [Bdellovibrionales bacterium RIFOXYC1_FULL_39_130]OFZ72421.1 MAG: hypothetical protein A2451_11510 [Bdellovibrionales bacterium RIFOXYC2_FULL_39_8]OFZ74167.1 MAG: hypothetical protein A2560_03765 [Bdellovibrionales bacterium RIFOXYD1_FULL_39_84]OFZ92016.1 MAG: